MSQSVKVGIIGGSGLGAALQAQTQGRSVTVDTPWGKPSAPIIETEFSGVPVAFLIRHGVGHTFIPSMVNYRANIYALKQLGVTHLIASGAVGSLREELAPRQIVLVDQFIDKTSRRAGTFFDQDVVVHAEFANPTCAVLRGVLESVADQVDTRVHRKGTYVCMEGPQFSTRAESLMHRAWGGDLIGMTAMPEAKLAREAEMAYALVALVTDYDCWREHVSTTKEELLREIIGHLDKASSLAIDLIRAAVARIGTMSAASLASDAHHALDISVWTHLAHVPAEKLDRYGVLLARTRAARSGNAGH